MNSKDISVLVGAVLALVFTVSVQKPIAGTAVASPCVWEHEFHSTLEELGENPKKWKIKKRNKYWGAADIHTRRAWINRQVPCHAVADVVRHETMHLWQRDLYGSQAKVYKAYADNPKRIEIVADCAAKLLGNTRGVYRLEQYRKTGTDCTERDLADAYLLLDLKQGA